MYKQVNILIGSACNMKCSYCLQQNGKSPADQPSDVEDFANKLAQILKGSSPKKIMYWGGEPMLYWKKIKTIHSVLKKNGVVPEKSVFTTNGKLLNDEYVDYANANKDFFTVISAHDWKFETERLRLFFRLNQFSFSELITHKHHDLWETRKRFYWLWDNFGKRPNLCVHFLRANDGCSPENYMTKEDVDQFIHHIGYEILPMAVMGDHYARFAMGQLLFERNRVINKGDGALCVRKDVLSIDTHGNVYNCHHNFETKNIVRNLFNNKVIPIVSADLPDPNRFIKSEECKLCDIFEQCRGGCYSSNTHEIDCYFAKERAKLFELIEWTEKQINEHEIRNHGN